MNMTNECSDDLKGGGTSSPRVGLTPDALPEVSTPFLATQSPVGASTENAPVGTETFAGKRRLERFRHWYALRATYGRERKAYEYLVSHDVAAFLPTLTAVRVVNGKRTLVEESRLPNLFFSYGTEDEIRAFVYDNVNLPYLRFYCRKISEGCKISHQPLIVPAEQLESFRIICQAADADVITTSEALRKFETGQPVRVVAGEFKGVVGRVARHKGQQRVGIVIEGLLTVVTAYIPSAFLKRYEVVKKRHSMVRSNHK